MFYVGFYVFGKLSGPARLGLGCVGARRRLCCGVFCIKKAFRRSIAHCRCIAAGAGGAVCFCTAYEPEEGASTAAAFLYSPIFWSILVAILGVVCIVLLLRRQKWTIQMLSTGALCVALAFVLSCLTLYRMPNGGSVTPASMLPILVFAWIYGPIPGIAAGTMDGIMQLVQGAYVIHPMQFLLDYILPFAVLGIAGLFRKDNQLPLGIVLGSAARFIIHVLSGVIYFASSAPAGQSPLLYSLGYNATYLVPELIICLAIVLVPRMKHALIRIKHEAKIA